ncbi:MAG: lysylphosphatidylglycerol synthase domain-containing protein [Acidimicrobiia bacterium]
MSGAVQDLTTERRTGDLARLIIGGLGVSLAGLWAQASTSVDTNLFTVVNSLPDNLEGLADTLNALGSIWFVAAIVVVLLIARWLPAARDAALAGGMAWLIAIGLNELLGTRSASELGIVVRTGSGPTFPSASVAVIAALTIALAPYLVRPLRRLAMLLIVLVALAVMYLGTGLTSDVIGGLFLGLAAGAAVHVAFGAPSGRPSAAQIQTALGDLGLDVSSLEPSTAQFPGATIMDGSLAGGGPARVLAFGRDQRDGQIAAKLWHNVMYKDPGLPVFGSRIQTVEHLAYASMLAEHADVLAPRVKKTGSAGQDIAVLVTDEPNGRPLSGFGAKLSDSTLAAAWAALDQLHDAGITHGNLGPDRVLVRDDGRVAFADLGTADVTVDPYRQNRDVAALLVTTSLLVDLPITEAEGDAKQGDGSDTKGDDGTQEAAAPPSRAIAAAIAAIGNDRVGAAVPLIQPAALPRGAGRGTKHFAKRLKALRHQTATAAGVEEAAALKIKRLSLVNIGMLAGVLLALAIAIPSLTDINWASVQKEFENATWGWAVLALILYPLVPVSWATALLGCVNADLPFVPTVLTQLACSFLNLITPNGIGGTGLQLDYLHKEGVPVASGASAMVLSTGVGGAIQMVLFLIAAAITSTQVESSNSGGVSLGAIAVGAALVGVVLAIPKVRGKVVPAVKRAASDIWAVLRNPKKAMQLFGGDLAGNLVYPFLLGLCLLAFGAHLSFAQLVVVQVGAGMLGNVAPVPGGIGVQEAALTAGLTAFGIDSNVALATVIVFRGITFALPPVFGFFTLQWLRRSGYA